MRSSVRAAGGKIWGVTYGYPNYCGDGDGDGWDVSCATRVQPAARTVQHTTRQTSFSAAPAAAGHYSYAGLEQLWVSAGVRPGPRPRRPRWRNANPGGTRTHTTPAVRRACGRSWARWFRGSLTNPYTNALNAVSKFRASGDTWAQWVCKP